VKGEEEIRKKRSTIIIAARRIRPMEKR